MSDLVSPAHYLKSWQAQTRWPGDETESLKVWRQDQMEAFVSCGWPTRADEAWHYANLRGLRADAYELSDGVNKVAEETAKQWLLAHAARLPVVHGVFVDGHWCASLANMPELPPGAMVGPWSQLDWKTVPSNACEQLMHPVHTETYSDPLALLNGSAWQDGLLVMLDGDVQLATPLHIVCLSTSHKLASVQHFRHIMRLGPHSQAAIHVTQAAVSDQESPSVAVWQNQVVQINLQPSAQLSYQQWFAGEEQVHATQHIHVLQQEHSVFQHSDVRVGKGWSRHALHAELLGAEASCDSQGVHVLSGQGYHDQQLNIEHKAEHTKSVQDYRGLIGGSGQSVFRGRAIVHAGAQDANANQHDHNLLLSTKARAYTKPELEIYADSVQCQHGATVGQLSEEVLFYLRSRGIPLAEARLMLTQGFAEAILQRINNPGWSHWVHHGAQQQLAALLAEETGV